MVWGISDDDIYINIEWEEKEECTRGKGINILSIELIGHS